MKYTYAYKTRDGQRHEAAMEAASREAVFSALRAQGIKPIKVVAADGTKANGEVHGVRKRIVFLVVVTLLLFSFLAVHLAFRAGEHSNIQTSKHSNIPPTAPRHQIYGDPVIMAAFEQGDFTGVFDQPGDQLLAWFAQPGKLMCPPNANVAFCTDKMASNLLSVAEISLLIKTENPSLLIKTENPSLLPKTEKPSLLPKTENVSLLHEIENISLIIITEKDSREVRELKQIVNGMREELRAYLANGNGTVYSYWRRLNERLAEERQIYERTKRELEADPSPTLRAARNAAMRNLGLRTIPAPKQGPESMRKSQ